MGNSQAPEAKSSTCAWHLCPNGKATIDTFKPDEGYHVIGKQNTSHNNYTNSLNNNDTSGVKEHTDIFYLWRQIDVILLTKVLVVIAVFGVVGNALTLWLQAKRHHRDLRQARARAGGRNVGKMDMMCLITLTASDLLLCVSLLPHANSDLANLYKSRSFQMYYDLYENGIINTFVLISTWLTIAMTINRYVHLCHPMFALRYFGSRFMKTAISMSVIGGIAFSIPRYWKYEIQFCDCLPQLLNQTGLSRELRLYAIAHGYLKKHETLDIGYHWVHFFIGITIPLLTLAYCNGLIIYTVYKSRGIEQCRNRERNLMTRTLICVVILYLMLVSPAEMTKFFQQYVSQVDVSSYNMAVSFLNILQAANFACNFIPFLVLDKSIRRSVFSCGRRKLAKTVWNQNGNGYRRTTTTSTVGSSKNDIEMRPLKCKKPAREDIYYPHAIIQ